MKKIDFDNITNDPITNVSSHIEKNVSQIIDGFFKDEFEETRPNNAFIVECDKKIIQNKKDIEQKKIDDRIEKIEANNLWITFLFFILIGFLFWKKYKKNKEIIDNYLRFKVRKIRENNELLRLKNIAIFSSFSTITLRDIYYYVFEKLGIQIAGNISSKKIIELIDDEEILDVYSCVSGTIKNTPFYDVVVRKLYYNDVVWSNNSNFEVIESSSNTNNGIKEDVKLNEVTVSTPFIEKKNLLIFKTNFLDDLVLSSHNVNFNYDLFLENKEFVENYRIIDYSKNGQKLSQFFTIKAQDDFVKWYKREKGKIFNFLKKNNLFVVKNYTYFLSSLEEMNKTLESLVSVKDIENLNLDSIKNVLKRKAIGYFMKFSKMIQLPLMVPGISREWYRESGKYLIGKTSEFEIERIDNEEKIDIWDVPNKFLDPKYFWFNSKEEPKKPIWISFDSSKVINNCKVAFIKINSFYSIENYSNSSEISYETYVKFDENKIVIHFPKYKQTKTQYVVTKRINLLIFENHYIDKSLFNKVKELSFWTNDPSKFENSLNRDDLINMTIKFNEIDEKYNLQAALKIDEYGLYITINNIQNVNNEILNELCKMLKTFSTIKY